MLVLRRKVGESLAIGDDIKIAVLSIEPNGNINIGIEAPKSVRILRSELIEVADANKESALAVDFAPQLMQELSSALSDFLGDK